MRAFDIYLVQAETVGVSVLKVIMLKVIIRDGQLSASDTVYICYWLWLLDYSEMGSREWEFVSL